MSDASEDALLAEIAALRALIVRNLRDEIMLSRDATTHPDHIRLDFLQIMSRLYSNEQDREKQAAITGKALEIINEAIDAMYRSRSSTRTS